MRSPALFITAAGLLLGAGSVFLLPQSALFSVSHQHADDAAETGERWACPMMDFVGNRPGDCPVCGMKMTKVTAGELTREQQRRMEVKLTRVVEGPARALIRAYGTVRYDDRTAQIVIPRVAGRVVKRHAAALHAGTSINAGDPLVDLYSPEVFAVQGELASAVKLRDEPTIRALTERFERWNLSSVARAIIEGAAPADTVTVSSPFSGRVVLGLPGTTGEEMKSAFPQIGQEVMADTSLVRVVDPASFIIAVNVPEPRAHLVRVGQPVRVATDDLGELPDIPAEISWIAPELNLEIRAREIHIHLTDPNSRLLPGSLVNARFEAVLGADLRPADTTQPETWGRFTIIPKTAVLSTGVRNVAWKVVERQPDGRIRLELAPLALGPRLEDEAGNDVYVVRAGLKPGDEVATQGVFLIDSQAQLAGTPSLLFPRGAVAPSVGGHQH